MASVVHLLRRGDPALAAAVMARQLAQGDTVTAALLTGASADGLPPGVALRRVPGDLSHEALLELIFAADNVVTW
ncbi:MAG: hypothetical protein HY216_15195 [Candidatus Rokubacteria bacterium]|nr:hypothetical protein [Candidatus Rokubacteria bacterium]